jgi:hypothetical protein
MKKIGQLITTVALLVAIATPALAQATFYGPLGQYQGRAQTLGGTTNYYGPLGQYEGHSQTLGGTTNFYGPLGQYEGRMQERVPLNQNFNFNSVPTVPPADSYWGD